MTPRWARALAAACLACAACEGSPAPSPGAGEVGGLPAQVALAVEEGAVGTLERTVTLSNRGSCPLVYAATTSTSTGAAWLTATPPASTLAAGAQATITLSFDVVGPRLAPGLYTGTLKIAGTCEDNGQPARGSPRLVAVNLAVTTNTSCGSPLKADGTPCNDNDRCTQLDTCQGGVCTGANPIVCPAVDQCRPSNLCNAATGLCPREPDGTPCNDGSACTLTDTCQAGVCSGADPVVCTPVASCYAAGTCDPASGLCDDPFAPNKSACDDGDPATMYESCSDGVCLQEVAVAAPQTCRELQAATPETTLPNGIYTVTTPTGPRQIYCEMTTGGGGWTALFIGANGSTHVFDHFDTGTYTGTFNDPSTTQYLQRAPVTLGDRTAEIAVSCGGAMVSFAMTEVLRKWLVLGTRADWTKVTPRVLAGAVPNVPNTVFTGVDATNQSFIFARDEGIFANTFASSYSNSTTRNYCNGVLDTLSTVRIYYRESPRRPIHNTEATAGRSCRAILIGGGSRGDGHYWLAEPAVAPYLAYCDMTTDGGGWTGVFAGRNGTTNVFGHLDVTSYTEVCTDPATHCLRRAPAWIGDSASELAVSCGTAMVSFALTNPARDWLVSGTQSGAIDLTPRVVSGTVPTLPNQLFTGSSSTTQSFIVSNGAPFAGTFASSYENSVANDYCNGKSDQASMVRVFYREAAPTPVHNTPATAAASCRAILLAGDSLGDGIYWLSQPPGAPYQAYCDMTTDGGGWTTVFAGRNGHVNVFDHFDNTSYQGICTDPATHCVRRAPATLGDSATELAVSCGGAAVGFLLTRPARAWLVDGTQASNVPLTGRVLAGIVPNLPDTLFTGSSVTNQSFIFSNGSPFSGTFAASGPTSGTSRDYCNGVFDQASLVRVMYREAAPTPIYNTEATARRSCREIKDALESLGDGLYYLVEPAGTPYAAYCDMTQDGGGWTGVFAGHNGTQNVFDHFDAVPYVGTCTDPATHCVRRPPSAGDSATQLAVSCGDARVRFALTEPVRKWLVFGTQDDWQTLTPTVVSGTIPNIPNTLFTGLGTTNLSFAFALGEGIFSENFAASGPTTGTSRDYCNGVRDDASVLRILYREVAPTPVHNTPATAGTSCKTLRDALLGAGQVPLDGVYWLEQTPGAPYQAACEMTTAGGGWTAAFSGRNGTTNVFDRFDTGSYQGICTDAATRCLRRAPSTLTTAGSLAVSCGGAFVTFPMTAGARNWLVDGARASWQTLVPTVAAGTVAAATMPNQLWTGSSASNQSFIFAHDQNINAGTFASSYSNSTNRNFCNGVADAASQVRVYYRE